MGVVDALTEWRARRWLAALTGRLGADGPAVAAAVPGVAAAVDQHAAAVRDILRQSTGTGLTERVLLAGYGRGLLDRVGAPLEGVGPRGGEWTHADWLALRLLAVCALSRPAARLGAGPSATAR